MDGSSVATLRIRTGKEKQLVRHHPWVFSGALEKNTQPISVDDPQVVRLEDARGNFIAYGWYDQLSHIPIRLLSWDKAVFPDVTWWADTLSNAVRRRMELFKSSQTSAFRLVHGEADFLPGLTVDVYNDCIVCIVSARVAWTHRLVIVKTLQRLLNPSQILISVDSTFGGITALSNGFIARVVDGASKTFFIITNNAGFRENGFTNQYNEKVPSGTYSFSAVKNIREVNGVALRLTGGANDYFEFIVRDDLTELSKMAVAVHGHEVEY